MSKKDRARYVPKRKPDASKPAAEMSQWDVMLAIYPYERSVLAAGLCGQRSVPLEGLLLGCPPAQGSLLVDWALFASELGVDYGVLIEPAVAGGQFADVGSSLSIANLNALQQTVGRHVVPPLDDRVDFYKALLGDLEAAHELRARHVGRQHLVTAALDGLVLHATVAGSKPIVWRVGLGMEVFLGSIWSAQGDVVDAAKAARILVDWSSAHRERDRDTSVEVGKQSADDRAADAVEDAAEWLQDRRSPVERAQAEQAEKRRAEAEAKAGVKLVETAFQAWRRMRSIGMPVPEDLQRKAADAILVAYEREEDRHIPVDIHDPAEAFRVCQEESDRLDADIEQSIEEQAANPDAAREAAHEEARKNLGRTAADESRFRRAAGDQSHVDASLDGMSDAEIERLAEEQQAEGVRAFQRSDEAKKAAQAKTMKVIGPVRSKASGMGDNDLQKAFEGVADTPLTLRVAEDVAVLRDDLVRDWPHAVATIDALLGDVREGEVVRVRPTLLVGSPGSGKTTLAKAIACMLGLPITVYPCASVSDGSFGGTPAQWSTKRPSAPLEAIRQAEVANPCFLLDEIEKAGINERNGSLVHALLPMLERHTASSYFEVGLEQTADLSAVVFIATANSLDGLPAPLLDRFRVLRMPDPGPQHIGDLARTIVSDIVGDRRLDRRWVPDLAPDELDVVRRAWGGGSLRRLRRAVEATLEARESVLRGRAM